MSNFDVFPINILETTGRIKRQSFIFEADQCLVWYQGNCIRTVNSLFSLHGDVSCDGNLDIYIDNDGIEDYIDDFFSFAEVSHNKDRVLWSNDLFGGGVGFRYPNMSLFYVGGKVARVYINRSNPMIMLEFLSPLARGVQEPESELLLIANKIANLTKKKINFDNIEFVSSSHQRYEYGETAGQLHVDARRSIVITKNINGCEGYDLEPGDGYIFKIINLDSVHPIWGNNVQVTPKPVRIISQDEDRTVMRGYQCYAQGPFGRVPFNGSDVGLIIDHKYGEITKCTFHRYDKDLRVEYYK